MDDKTLKELVDRKHQLEAEITELINAFEGEFAVEVAKINLTKEFVIVTGGKCIHKQIKVETEIIVPCNQ